MRQPRPVARTTRGGRASRRRARQGNGSNNSINCAPDSPMFALLSTTVAAPVGAGETLAIHAARRLDPRRRQPRCQPRRRRLRLRTPPAPPCSTRPRPAYDASDVFFQCAANLTACSAAATTSGVYTLPANRGGGLYLAAACGGIAGQYCNAGGSNGAWSLVQLWWAQPRTRRTPRHQPRAGSAAACSSPARTARGPRIHRHRPGGPGVYKVAVQIDGSQRLPRHRRTPTRATARPSPPTRDRALMFDFQQPCLQTESVDLPIDTTSLADGQHKLKVIVTDAAQNSSTVLDQTITTRNRTTVSALLDAPPATPRRGRPCYAFALDARRRLTRRCHPLYSALGAAAGRHARKPGAPAPGRARSRCGRRPAGGGALRSRAHHNRRRRRLEAHRTARPVAAAARRRRQGAQGRTSCRERDQLRETVTPTLTLHVRNARPRAARLHRRARDRPARHGRGRWC